MLTLIQESYPDWYGIIIDKVRSSEAGPKPIWQEAEPKDLIIG